MPRKGKTEGREDSGAPDISDRTLEYGVRAVRLYQALQNGEDRAGWVIGKQYLRSATSVGANVAEAQAGETRRDFLHKYGIALKEARESIFWLRLLKKSELMSSRQLGPITRETREIASILASSILHAKENAESRQ